MRSVPTSGRTVLVIAALASAPVGASAQTVDTLAADSLRADSLAADSTLAVDSLAAGADTSAYDGALPNEAAIRLTYITRAAPETPEGMGLVETGMAEARIAAQHVTLAGRDSTNLFNMQRHMAHVLHAIDPAQVGEGPGLGFGVVRAAEEIQRHLEELTFVEGLPGVVEFHAPWVARAARGTLARAATAVELARRVQSARSAREAHTVLERLAKAVRDMTYGFDRDDDGRIGYTEDEMGLAQVRYHLGVVERLTR